MHPTNWTDCEAYLKNIRSQYESLPNGAGWFVLGHILPPLEKRFNAGVRTEDLAREIYGVV